jgi:hypothetical protein
MSEPRRVAGCRWRLVAFPAAVFAVHQLCYLLEYGSGAGDELTAHGDRYVATAVLVALALVAISLGGGLSRLFGAWRGRRRPAEVRVPLWLVWLGWTLALLAGFCALEGLEIALEPHHTGGMVGVFGNGGWWALPAAAFVAAVVALFLRGGRALLAIVAGSRGARCARIAPLRYPAGLGRVSRRRPMASCAAGRAPPVIGLV